MYDKVQEADGIGITEDNLNDRLFEPASLKTLSQSGNQEAPCESEGDDKTMSLREIIDQQL